jgi:biopolymer transport protein ExbD
MVDLAFLLITFFMLTTTLSKPQSMDLTLPDKQKDINDVDIKVDENKTMTLLLGENGKLISFMGMINNPLSTPKDFAYGKDGIRKELIKRMEAVKQYSIAQGQPGKGIIVIIKPNKKSTYRNLVDVLDEMAIVGVNKTGSYAIVNDFAPEEVKLLEGNN